MTAPPDLKWGISTLGCHELDLPAICSLAAEHGIHALEIRSLADCLNLPEYLDEMYPDDPAAVQQILDEHGQSIIALNSGFKLTESGQGDRDELEGFARWADALRIPYIRVFGGGSMDTDLTDSDLDHAASNIQWWRDLLEQNDWQTSMALETHTGFSSSARCSRLLNHVDGSLDIIWDTHHTWKYGNESAEETWSQLGDSICHIHVKDSISVPSARHPYSYVLAGAGEFPVTDVFKVLNANDYEGVVSLEWERKWHPYLPDLGAALPASVKSGWKRSSSG